jgi:excisionase family DNA binding protein
MSSVGSSGNLTFLTSHKGVQSPQEEEVVQPMEDSAVAPLLTVTEVAATLRVSNMTVYRLINTGALPAIRIGRSFRIREGDFSRYLADQYTKAG